MNIGYTLIRDKSTDDEKRAFIDWCNENGCTYKSENGVWTIISLANEGISKPDYAAEIMALKNYLNETDKHAIKCAERGLEMKYEYPAEYVERQNARDRINELERLLGGSI